MIEFEVCFFKQKLNLNEKLVFERILFESNFFPRAVDFYFHFFLLSEIKK